MPELIGAAPILIAHRGYSGRYPENTLLAYKAAYQHGARFMELDLQLTADRVPFLHHDRTLKRMAGVDLDIRDTNAKQVRQLKASYSARFGDDFADNSFTSFKKFCKWLKSQPEVMTFIEIKQDSIDRFGMSLVVDEVYKRILQAEVEGQCVIISFNPEAVEYSRNISSMQVGWVVPKWVEANHLIATRLEPEYLFCDKNFLPENDSEIWNGSWQWAIYNLDDAVSAIAMANRGFSMLETNQIGSLMENKELSES